MKSNYTKLIIGILGCAMAIYSIVAEFIPLLMPEKTDIILYKPISFFLPFLIIGDFPYGVENALGYQNSGNIVCLIINILFLAGSVLYLTSKGKETRLIRFGYGVVFISAASSLLLLVFFFLSEMNFTVGFIKLLYIAVAIFALKCLASGKQLKVSSVGNYTQASTGERLLHFVIDFILIFCFFLIWMNVLQEKFDIESNKLLLYLPIALIQVLYYFLFEAIFGATPAKYLTETQTIEKDWGRPSAGSIFKRSFSRIVPFEHIAFATGSRWHDTWSNTDVVKEQQTGVGGKKYAIGTSIFIILAAGSFFAINTYQEQKEDDIWNSRSEEEKQIHQSNLQKRADRLSTDAFIALSDYKWYKVERVSGDTIAVVHAPKLAKEETRVGEAVEAYRGYHNTTYTSDSLLYLSKSKLLLAAASPDNKVAKIGKYEYGLRYIAFIDEPCFVVKDITSNTYGDSILSCRIKNEGWQINIVDIEQRKGKIEWDLDEINRYNYNWEVDFRGKIISEGPEYEAVFTHRHYQTERKYLLRIRTYKDRGHGIDAFLEELD